MINVFQRNDRRTNVTRKRLLHQLNEDNFSKWQFAEYKKEGRISCISGVLGLICQVIGIQETNIQTNNNNNAKIQIQIKGGVKFR